MLIVRPRRRLASESRGQGRPVKSQFFVLSSSSVVSSSVVHGGTFLLSPIQPEGRR